MQSPLAPNRLILDLRSNDAIRELFSGLAVGESVKLEVEAQVDEVTAEQASLTILEAEAIDDTPAKPEPAKDGEEGTEGKEQGPPSAVAFMPQGEAD